MIPEENLQTWEKTFALYTTELKEIRYLMQALVNRVENVIVGLEQLRDSVRRMDES